MNFRLSLLMMISILASCGTRKSDVKTVENVDLTRYAGKWYEISSFPQSFQKGCNGTTAVYTVSPKGYVIVENRCFKGSMKGKESYIKGKAFVVKNSGNAKLKVQFFWPFKGDYWILDLADDYSYAVVGSPNKKYLWILSRTPEMDENMYNNLISGIAKKGFDIQKLKKTNHKE
ncbi:MAG: lipocalin family protein [Saprospiraceae bacterium]|nr:lipocalin family protein [Saprospiraceae bacterium]